MYSYLRFALGATAMLALVACNNQQKRTDQTTPTAPASHNASAPIPKAMLGVRMAHAGPALAKQLGVDADKTTLITYVAENTPAQRAGFEQWDLIVEMEDAPDASPASIRKVLRSSQPGDTVVFTILRADKRTNITAVLEKSDTERMLPLPPQPTTSTPH